MPAESPPIADTEGSFALVPRRDGAGAVVDFEVVEAEGVVERLLARPVSAIVGHTLREVFPIPRVEQFIAGFRQVLASGEPQELEYPILHGAMRATWVWQCAVRDGDRLLVRLRDLTGAKLEDVRLAAAGRLRELLFDHSPLPIIVHGPDGRLTDANAAFLALSGYPRDRLDTLRLPQLLDLAVDAAEAGGPQRRELRRADGMVRAVDLYIDHLPHGFRLVSVHDASATVELERVRSASELALRESEARFRSAFEESAAGMALVTRDGRTLRVNRALCAMLGYTEAELLGLTWRDIVYADDLRMSLENWEELDRDDVTSVRAEKRYHRRDGSLLWVQVILSKVRDEAGRPLYFIAQVEDITERWRLTQALADSEGRFRSAFEEAGVGMALLTPRGETVRVNRALAGMLGYDLDTARELPWREILRADESFEHDPGLARVARGESHTHRFERRGVHRDGMPVWMQVTVSAVRAEAGMPIYLLAHVEDITERKRLGAALFESEQQLRLALTAGDAAAFSWSEETRRLWCSETGFRLFGFAPGNEPATPVGLTANIVAEDREPLLASLREVMVRLDGEVPFTYRFRVTMPDGALRCVEARGARRRLPSGERELRAIARDVTEEVEREVTRAAMEDRLRRVLDATRDGIWDWHLVEQRTYTSPRYRTMLGYPAEEGMPPEEFLALLHPDDRARVSDLQDRHILAPQEMPYDIEFRMRRVDGSWAWIRSRGQVVERDAKGRALRMMGTHTDVTERRVLEEQFRQAQKMEAVGKLAGGVAHDFNNLLTAIQATTELLLQDLAPDDPRRSDVTDIALACDRATTLTRQLLSFSRQEVERLVVVEIDAIVDRVGPLLQRMMAPEQRLVIRQMAPRAFVEFDPSQFELGMLNLVANARDAMPHGGTVTVRTDIVSVEPEQWPHLAPLAPGRYVRVAVQDTGTGMSEEVRSHLFEPFFTTKPQGKGTGLGLATVYGFMERMRGAVTVDSAPGQGSTFSLYLPLVPPPSVRGTPLPSTDRSPRRGHGRHILIVDDETILRRTTRRLLERRGYTVFEAGDAEEALRVLDAAPPGSIHMVLTDQAMPGRTGRQLLDDVSRRFPQIRGVLMSGFAGDTAVREALSDRKVPFVPKPFTIDELIAALEA